MNYQKPKQRRSSRVPVAALGKDQRKIRARLTRAIARHVKAVHDLKCIGQYNRAQYLSIEIEADRARAALTSLLDSLTFTEKT